MHGLSSAAKFDFCGLLILGVDEVRLSFDVFFGEVWICVAGVQHWAGRGELQAQMQCCLLRPVFCLC